MVALGFRIARTTLNLDYWSNYQSTVFVEKMKRCCCLCVTFTMKVIEQNRLRVRPSQVYLGYVNSYRLPYSVLGFKLHQNI